MDIATAPDIVCVCWRTQTYSGTGTDSAGCLTTQLNNVLKRWFCVCVCSCVCVYSPNITSVCIGIDSARCLSSQLSTASLSTCGLSVQVSLACTSTEPSLCGMCV